MANKKVATPDEQTRWFQRGFNSKNEYIGWLWFNDLADDSLSYDDTYYDQYSGETKRISDEDGDRSNSENEAFD